jgi:hypothetical protein
MIAAVAKLIPKKMLNKEISTTLYEGAIEGEKLTLTSRETRHLEGTYIPRAVRGRSPVNIPR